MAKRKKQRVRLVDESFDPGPGLRAFADVLAPQPEGEPEAAPVRPPSRFTPRWLCEFRVPGCRSRASHGAHGDPLRLLADSELPPEVVLAAGEAAVADLRGYRLLAARTDGIADTLLLTGPRGRFAPLSHLGLGSPGRQFDRHDDGAADERLDILLSRRHLTLPEGRKAAAWQGLSAAAQLALLEHFGCDERIAAALCSAQIPGPYATACIEACEASGVWSARVMSSLASLRKVRGGRPAQLQAWARDAASRTRRHPATPEMLAGLGEGWQGSPTELTAMVALLLGGEQRT